MKTLHSLPGIERAKYFVDDNLSRAVLSWMIQFKQRAFLIWESNDDHVPSLAPSSLGQKIQLCTFDELLMHVHENQAELYTYLQDIPADREAAVCISAPSPSFEWILIDIACILMGMCVLPLPDTKGVQDLERSVTQASALLDEENHVLGLIVSPCPVDTCICRVPVCSPQTLVWKRKCEGTGASTLSMNPCKSRWAAMIETSGTTGTPKLARFS